METNPDSKTFAAWVRRESKALAEDWPMGSRDEKKLLESWGTQRPQMLADLRRLGVAEELAHVLRNREGEAVRELLKARMGPTDAREQAAREWLMLEPEKPDAEEA